MSVISPPLVAGTTTTAGTGPFVISGIVSTPASGIYRQWSGLTNGSHVLCIRADDGGANYEMGVADVSVSAGVATLTWNPRVDTSAGGSIPVSWPGGGTQTVWTIGGSIIPSNGGSEFAPYAAAFRSSIGVDTSAIHPSYRFGLIPAGAGTDGAWTGGTVGKVVRYSSPNTMANAANTDTDAQLGLLALLTAQGYYAGSGLVTGLSGLTAGAIYFLGTGGNMLAWTSGVLPVIVTAGGSVKLVRLGFAPSTTSLLWNPQVIARG